MGEVGSSRSAGVSPAGSAASPPPNGRLARPSYYPANLEGCQFGGETPPGQPARRQRSIALSEGQMRGESYAFSRALVRAAFFAAADRDDALRLLAAVRA